MRPIADATMTAHARSPVRSSGTPTTATSAMLGMPDEDVLDLFGRDVLAVADDDVLGPAGDHEVLVVHPAAEVAGAEVAVVIEGFGLVFGMQIADQHLRSARSDLAVDQLDVGDPGASVGVRRVLGVVSATRRW